MHTRQLSKQWVPWRVRKRCVPQRPNGTGTLAGHRALANIPLPDPQQPHC